MENVVVGSEAVVRPVAVVGAVGSGFALGAAAAAVGGSGSSTARPGRYRPGVGFGAGSVIRGWSSPPLRLLAAGASLNGMSPPPVIMYPPDEQGGQRVRVDRTILGLAHRAY
ncbi:hypothetical protein [Streptomyces tagetis]|uniref:Uncharacterized protein n=1 Tax=Streptomyces tagetis TaxID=2820809 RepID=A0A941B2Y9_9ACTN|nr:hypothetical protein [Streptomyces sp. RG38]MBQ0827682.1 hypothetical protein [Streptomyces sp. RG38]